MPNISRQLIDQLSAKIQRNELPGCIVDPVPRPQSQEGPNCGFYALSIVMDYWKAKGMAAASFPARKRDVALQGRHAGEAKGRSLRNLGKEAGALDLDGQPKLSTGGVFTANQLASVAKATQTFTARVITAGEPGTFIDRICAIVKFGIPPIIAFDVVQGDPKSDQGGQHSHWGVVFGYFEVNRQRVFLATHSHGQYYRWFARDLQSSNFALNGTRRELPEERKVSVEGLEGDKGIRVARPHWRTTAELAAFEAKKPPTASVRYLPGKAPRPATHVLQNLAHQIVVVYPSAS
jgi:hypothetical protein